jgi:membrane protease YdiL (CAAX protease family)
VFAGVRTDHQLVNCLDYRLGNTWNATGGGFSSRDWLYAVDVTFGIALVAYQEEVVFRRCARAVLNKKLGSGTTMVFASALLFGSYHWSRGLGTIITAALFGIVAMTFYVRAGVLWPLVLVHYVTDVVW